MAFNALIFPCMSDMCAYQILCPWHRHVSRGGDRPDLQLILDGTSVVSDSQDACDDSFAFGLERHGLNVSLFQGRLRLDLSDGQSNATLTTDDFCSEKLLDGHLHHVAFIVDGAVGIVTAVVDGVLCDGGTERDRGWEWLPSDCAGPHTTKRSVRICTTTMGAVGAATLRLAPSFRGFLASVEVYERAIYNYEAVGAWRAGWQTNI